MSRCCGFLSDPEMSLSTLEELCSSLFVAHQASGTSGGGDNLEEAFEYDENVGAIAEHPLFEKWLRAKDDELVINASKFKQGGGSVASATTSSGTGESKDGE
jgi:hypothetical protein